MLFFCKPDQLKKTEGCCEGLHWSTKSLDGFQQIETQSQQDSVSLGYLQEKKTTPDRQVACNGLRCWHCSIGDGKASGCFHRQLRTIRRRLPIDAVKTLANCFVTSRLDYFSSLLEGQPTSQLDRLQRVFNAAANSFTMRPKNVHALPLLHDKQHYSDVHSTSKTSSTLLFTRHFMEQHKHTLTSCASWIMLVNDLQLYDQVEDANYVFLK